MPEDDIKDMIKEWAGEFDTLDEFVNEIPPTMQGVVEVILDIAEERGFLGIEVFRQLVHYMSYMNCHLCSDVLNLIKEEYLRMCEVSFDAFVNISATHETSDRRDH